MAIVLQNAILLNIDPPSVSRGDIRIEHGVISDVGCVATAVSDEIIDCGGCVVMPGLVNGHTHLYSALATGMPPPPRVPTNFHEILELVWWRLDRALDAESIEMSGAIGALDALRCGTTTLIDHHASPGAIANSLDFLEKGIGAVGLRAVLCYETTDRNGMAGATEGLNENRRYLNNCATRKGGRFAAMVGAHAAFTMSDESLSAVAAMSREFSAGAHIHVAEDSCDDRICREKYGAPLVERLEKSGVIQSESILAHCIHLSADHALDLSPRVAAVAHNPRSNMNNRVGYAPIGSLSNIQLGTDGIGGDMFTESKHAWFKACDAKTSIGPNQILAMLAQSARTASRRLGCTLGTLIAGAAADVVITDYQPATEFATANAAGHLIFAMGPQHVRHVLIDGKWSLKDRLAVALDEAELRARSRMVAAKFWKRLEKIKP